MENRIPEEMTATSSNPSGSEAVSFGLLHPAVQRWVWQQGWTELRDIQDEAIPLILDGERDVILSAGTASGKTEAAFLPIISSIAGNEEPGFKALYISPLKALINDQFSRLDLLCDAAEVPIARWHGDVSSQTKEKARSNPSGIVLITPESLEALFVRRGREIRRLFGNLRYVVIDELHAFIGIERGMQTGSLLNRIEIAIGRKVPRIGLSATLGDIGLAAECLRPGGGDDVACLQSRSDSRELKVQVRGYLAYGNDEGDENGHTRSRRAIARHAFECLKGSHNLMFAGSRQKVEMYADVLSDMAEKEGRPNEFFPHHGNLSKEVRESVERRLKDRSVATTAVCTTTLELGIDIGEVESVAQVGAPRSIASLRQRLGRSGRRAGKPAVLRLYVEEIDLASMRHPLDWLRVSTAQCVAAIRLLVAGWCEPPVPASLHLSTLAHQVLSVIAEKGGVTAAQAWNLLCEKGPFRKIDKMTFINLLRNLGDERNRLIEQAPDGSLMLGEAGEKLVAHYSFFAVFETPEEYRVLSSGRHLGMLPVETPLKPGMMMMFAGRRWQIKEVRPAERVIDVVPSRSGQPPKFGGSGMGPLHDRLVSEMREVYAGTDVPAFLNATGRKFLADGRDAWRRLGLDTSNIVEIGGSTLVFPWVGTTKVNSLFMALQGAGLNSEASDLAIEVWDDASTVRAALSDLAEAPAPDAMEILKSASIGPVEKFDRYLDSELLKRVWASIGIDAGSIPGTAAGALLRQPCVDVGASGGDCN